MPFAGGIMQHGYQCGMIWGAVLAAGAQAYRLFGPGPQAEANTIIAAKRLTESFRAYHGEINCSEITDIDRTSSVWKMIYVFLIRGKTIGCFRMSAKYAQKAFRRINTTFSDDKVKTLNSPVSCSAMLARKMGLSDMHVGMVSGFAGGIGLSGGACGALGAAIWIFGMNSIKQRNGRINYKDSGALAVIRKFLKSTDYQFECSEIVGRKFENISDHAAHLRDGGCAKIIKALSVQ